MRYGAEARGALYPKEWMVMDYSQGLFGTPIVTSLTEKPVKSLVQLLEHINETYTTKEEPRS